MKIQVEKEVKKMNRAHGLLLKTLFSASDKDEEKSACYDIFKEIF
jgi:hypothetical protein